MITLRAKKKKMKAIQFKQIQVKDIYVSILTKRLVIKEDGWMRMEPIEKKIEPTGSELMDRLAQALAKDCRLKTSDFIQTTGLSPNDFRVLFRLQTGLSLKDFIKQYQQMRACEWLAYTDLKYAEIAKRSGFASHSDMGHYFRKHLKCTLTDYRRLHRPANFRELYQWTTDDGK